MPYTVGTAGRQYFGSDGSDWLDWLRLGGIAEGEGDVRYIPLYSEHF